MFGRNIVYWLIVILRSFTVMGVVVLLAGLGILIMLPTRLLLGIPEQVANLLGPTLWLVGGVCGGAVVCRMAGTTLTDVLARYVFGEIQLTASNRPSEAQTLFLVIALGAVCPWLGFELVIVMIGSLAPWLPTWLVNSIRVLVMIGGGVDTVRLALCRYRRIFVDDPIFQALYNWVTRKCR